MARPKTGRKITNPKTGEESVYLTEVEMLKLELNEEKQKKAVAEKTNAQLVLKAKQLEIEIMKLQCESLSHEIADRQNKLNTVKKERETTIKAIKEKYQITKENFGYNTDTGQLIEE